MLFTKLLLKNTRESKTSKSCLHTLKTSGYASGAIRLVTSKQFSFYGEFCLTPPPPPPPLVTGLHRFTEVVWRAIKVKDVTLGVDAFCSLYQLIRAHDLLMRSIRARRDASSVN